MWAGVVLIRLMVVSTPPAVVSTCFDCRQAARVIVKLRDSTVAMGGAKGKLTTNYTPAI